MITVKDLIAAADRDELCLEYAKLCDVPDSIPDDRVIELYDKIISYHNERYQRCSNEEQACSRPGIVCGCDEADMLSEREELEKAREELDRIHELPEDEQKEYFVTSDELFSDLDKDEPTEEEKQRKELLYKRSCVLSRLNEYRAVRAVASSI